MDRSAETNHILIYTQTPPPQAAWYEGENIAALLHTRNTTAATRRRLPPENRCCHSQRTHCVQQQLAEYFISLLISPGLTMKNPAWNCKPAQMQVQLQHASNHLPKLGNHCWAYLILNWLITGKTSTSSVCPQHIIKDYVHRYCLDSTVINPSK